MRIGTISEARSHIGERLYWDDKGARYIFTRSGILDTPFNGQLAFDGNHDYYPISYYENLRTTYDISEDKGAK